MALSWRSVRIERRGESEAWNPHGWNPADGGSRRACRCTRSWATGRSPADRCQRRVCSPCLPTSAIALASRAPLRRPRLVDGRPTCRDIRSGRSVWAWSRHRRCALGRSRHLPGIESGSICTSPQLPRGPYRSLPGASSAPCGLTISSVSERSLSVSGYLVRLDASDRLGRGVGAGSSWSALRPAVRPHCGRDAPSSA